MARKNARFAIIALCLIAIFFNLFGNKAFAEQDDSLEIETETLESEYEQNLSSQEDVSDSIDAAREKLEKVKKEIQQINADLQETADKIIETSSKIQQQKTLVTAAESDLEAAQGELSEHYQELKGRIQMMYECGTPGYIELLVKASSISEFFSRLGYISAMVSYDNDIMNKLETSKQRVETTKEALVNAQEALEESQQEQVDEQNRLQSLLDDRQEQYESIENDIEAKKLLAQELESEQSFILSRINEVNEAISERDAAAQAQAEEGSHIHAASEQVEAENVDEESMQTINENSEIASEPVSTDASEPKSDPNTNDSSTASDSQNEESSNLDQQGEESETNQEESSVEIDNTESQPTDEKSGSDDAILEDSSTILADNTETSEDSTSDTQTTDDTENEPVVPDENGSYESIDREHSEHSDQDYRANDYGWDTWPGIGEGIFFWPTDSTTATSLFGPRTHPITGEYTDHNGLDLGAWYGANIYAAMDGTVIYTCTDGWGGSYGNYVMIDHGNGFVTLYAHQSEVLCEVGDVVSAGDVIGLVGSTGYSTGPHLHFEVYLYGGLVDPEEYL